jgi:predicted  nucleic acid-binding Zn-ribbon protein
MHRSVGEHIQNLEKKRDSLSGQIMAESDRTKLNQLETELRAVESALTHFRSAIEIQQRLSSTS